MVWKNASKLDSGRRDSLTSPFQMQLAPSVKQATWQTEMRPFSNTRILMSTLFLWFSCGEWGLRISLTSVSHDYMKTEIPSKCQILLQEEMESLRPSYVARENQEWCIITREVICSSSLQSKLNSTRYMTGNSFDESSSKKGSPKFCRTLLTA